MSRSDAYTVRIIDTEMEAFQLVMLAKEHHREMAPHLEFSDAVAMANAVRFISMPDLTTETMFLCFKGETPVGYFIGNISSYYFTNQRCANQTLLFVSEQYRGTRAAILMFEFFEEWARTNNCAEIFAGAWGNDAEAVDKINRIYPKLGYKENGKVFIKKLNRGEV